MTPWLKIEDRTPDMRTEAMQVPGGWLIRSTGIYQSGVAIAQTFIADPNQEWAPKATIQREKKKK